MASGNKTLGRAKKAKEDEFYTRLEDIERELAHYRAHFKGKTVLCNCDDPRVSNFFHYFSYNFEALGLKRLITTCYKNQDRDLFSRNVSEQAIWLEYTGDKNGNRVPDPEEIGIRTFKGNGDFRSDECVRLLEQADIVVTNPPFSLFREYVAQLVRHDKKNLHLREFSDAQKLKMYESQGGVCPLCGKKFALEEMHADHVTPWCKGGQTTLENGQMLCHDCNWTKGKR